MPEITVLLPLYNECDSYITASVGSILHQTYTNLKVLIRLDDPNNIRIRELIEAYGREDPRIDFAINEKNCGLPETLNRMIEDVKTPFIARMDGDDISFSNRLEIQYNFMKRNPEVDLCGAKIIHIDGDGTEIHRRGKLPTKREDIVRALRYIDVINHPTFFAKTAIMKKLKYRNLQYAQDYDLVCRMAEQGYVLTNINQYLLRYRSGKNQDVKLLKQHIIASEIQRYYSRGNLSDIDIVSIVQDKLKNLSDKEIKEYGQSTRNYSVGITALKKGNLVKAFIRIAKSFNQSKHVRGNIIKAFMYRYILFREQHAGHQNLDN